MSKRGRGETCHWCKRKLASVTDRSRLAATRDHYPIPKHQGGRETVWACRQCNGIKGAKSAEQWHRFMERNPHWWSLLKFRNHGSVPGHMQPTIHAPGLVLGREPEIPKRAPIEYADGLAQAAFEAVYDHRLHMLRVQPPKT